MSLDQELLEKIQIDIDDDEVLQELYNEYGVAELLTFSEFNIAEKISDNTFIAEQFRLLYLKEKYFLSQIEDIFDKKQGTLYDYYKFENEKTLTKTEIEKYYLPKDKKLQELKGHRKKQEQRVDFFESVWKALERQAWLLRAFQKEQI